MSDDPNGKPDDGVLLLELCKEHTLDPFCDYLKTPSVVLPADEFEKHWPLQSARVRAWLADAFYKQHKQLVSERSIAQVLRVLEGWAWKKQLRSPKDESLWSAIERDAVASALVCFANQVGEFDGLTRDFFMKLKDLQIVGRLGPLARQFPVNTQVLSRRLKQLIPSLSDIGLAIKVTHQDNGSHCVLRLEASRFVREPDGNSVSASGTPDGQKVNSDKDLESPDGTDAPSGSMSVTEQAALEDEIDSLQEDKDAK